MGKPTPRAALVALEKRDGRVCAWHGDLCGVDTLVPQHRMGGMGGSKSKHRLSNIIWLCSIMNGLIESDAELANEARDRGIKVPFWGVTHQVPVMYSDGSRYVLDDYGNKETDDFKELET